MQEYAPDPAKITPILARGARSCYNIHPADGAEFPPGAGSDRHNNFCAFSREERLMEHVFRPRGVCSQLMRVEVENGIIKKVEVKGGVQRQPEGHFQLDCGDGRPGSHFQDGGYPLRIQAHFLPRSARKSVAGVSRKRLKLIYIISRNHYKGNKIRAFCHPNLRDCKKIYVDFRRN